MLASAQPRSRPGRSRPRRPWPPRHLRGTPRSVVGVASLSGASDFRRPAVARGRVGQCQHPVAHIVRRDGPVSSALKLPGFSALEGYGDHGMTGTGRRTRRSSPAASLRSRGKPGTTAWSSFCATPPSCSVGEPARSARPHPSRSAHRRRAPTVGGPEPAPARDGCGAPRRDRRSGWPKGGAPPLTPRREAGASHPHHGARYRGAASAAPAPDRPPGPPHR